MAPSTAKLSRRRRSASTPPSPNLQPLGGGGRRLLRRAGDERGALFTFNALLVICLVTAGAAQLHPALYWFYSTIVPLQWGTGWIYDSGAAMVAAGMALMLDRWRQEAALAIVYILIAVLKQEASGECGVRVF